MSIQLMEITGIPHALNSLKMSKRHYDPDAHLHDIEYYREITDERGFIKPEYATDARYQNDTKLMVKWGAGVDMPNGNGTRYDAGHETLLRFIDFTFIVEGLHRGAMDDLDSHAKRFDNRIIRSSTRLARYAQSEKSSWYEGKILSTEEACELNGINIPLSFTSAGDKTIWVKAPNGYVKADYVNDSDVLRGNYPLSIPMSAILRINYVDLRHVYMRRNKYTHASPELQEHMEDLADQIEAALPGPLGKLIRYDYVKSYDGEGGKPVEGFAHIMNVYKTANITDIFDIDFDGE